MPPQPGVFAVSHTSTTHKVRAEPVTEVAPVNAFHYEAVAGPSSRPLAPSEDPKKDKRRKEIVGKLTREMTEREDIGRHYAEAISDLHSASIQLSTRPETYAAYMLRLYPLSLERGAALSAIEFQAQHALQVVRTAYEEERERVEEEWKKGHERILERMLEGIEERRRRAREEKDGEGTVVDGGVDSQSRPHITRKLRNKLGGGGGTSPPPTPDHPGLGNGALGSIGSGPVTTGPLLNPHSLSVDELPSPFPLPMIAAHSGVVQNYGYGAGAGGAGNGRRRAKGGGREAQAPGTLGKSLNIFHPLKESEYEADLGEIRRGNKRRRAAVGALAGKA